MSNSRDNEDDGSVTNITSLTESQRARFPEWRDRWIAAGLSTEPADRTRAEAAYRACYRYTGLDDGVPIVWVESPIVGALAAAISTELLGAGVGAKDLEV